MCVGLVIFMERHELSIGAAIVSKRQEISLRSVFKYSFLEELCVKERVKFGARIREAVPVHVE